MKRTICYISMTGITLAVVLSLLTTSSCFGQECPGGTCPTPPAQRSIGIYDGTTGRQLFNVPPPSQWNPPSSPSGPPALPTHGPDGKKLQGAYLYPFICEVITTHGRGSGVYVTAEGQASATVLTAAHVIKGHDRTKYVQLIFTRPNGTTLNTYATIGKVNENADIAILTAPGTMPGIHPIRLATAAPTAGTRVTMAGWAKRPRRAFLAHGATVKDHEGNWLRLTRTSSLGDSGGMVMDYQGRLVGIISSTSSLTPGVAGYTRAAAYGPIRWLLGLPPRWGYRQEQQQRQQMQRQQSPAPQQGYPAPQLPDTTNLVTRVEFEALRSKYEADRETAMQILREQGLLKEDVADAKQQVADAVQEAETTASENRSLIQKLMADVGDNTTGIIRIGDGKIAGVVPVEDFKALSSAFIAERAERIEEGDGLRERLAADKAALIATWTENKGEILDRAKSIALTVLDENEDAIVDKLEDKIPGIPWGLIATAIGIGASGGGLGIASLVNSFRSGNPLKMAAVIGPVVARAVASGLAKSNGDTTPIA